MQTLEFDFEGEAADGIKGAELACTWASLRVRVNNLLLTRVVDPSDDRIRDLIHVPLNSLAGWLATNWWSLLHESESQSATPITRSRPQATTKPLSANLSPRRSQPVADNGPARGHSDFRCSLPVLALPSAAQRPCRARQTKTSLGTEVRSRRSSSGRCCRTRRAPDMTPTALKLDSRSASRDTSIGTADPSTARDP